MRLGEYNLLRTIATGGMGEVYLAQLRGDPGAPLVAIKRVLPVHQGNEDILNMFLDEARIALSLGHPNLLETYSTEEDEGTPFIIMEYVPGKDLQKICKKGTSEGPFLPLKIACHIISQAAAGLHHAHTKVNSGGQPLHIVHRDVSPPNIMVSFGGDVKVIDFGIARADDNIASTGDEHFKGKFGYMSPEQALGLKVDHRSDIFSLGTLLYEITVKKRLFRAKGAEAARELVSRAYIPPPSLMEPSFPCLLEEIILRALSREPEMRFQTAMELHIALEGFLLELGAPIKQREIAAYMSNLFHDNTSTVIPKMTLSFLRDMESKEVQNKSFEMIEALSKSPSAKSRVDVDVEGRGVLFKTVQVPSVRGPVGEGEASVEKKVEEVEPSTEVSPPSVSAFLEQIGKRFEGGGDSTTRIDPSMLSEVLAEASRASVIDLPGVNSMGLRKDPEELPDPLKVTATNDRIVGNNEPTQETVPVAVGRSLGEKDFSSAKEETESQEKFKEEQIEKEDNKKKETSANTSSKEISEKQASKQNGPEQKASGQKNVDLKDSASEEHWAERARDELFDDENDVLIRKIRRKKKMKIFFMLLVTIGGIGFALYYLIVVVSGAPMP